MRSQKWSALQIGIGIFAVVILGAVISGAQSFDANLWKPVRWRLVGPARGGRTLAVSGVAGNPDVYYMGTVAGGVWKTTNAGLNWTPLTDTTEIRSIGAIAVAPSDANIIYAGTGESCIRGDISDGDGMWKSMDAGKTWMHIGLEDTRHISRIMVDPHDANIVLVAAMGHAFGPNHDRGVFRTTDGGKTWTKTLFKDDKTGAIDLSMDPQNPRIIFAALYQFVRRPWNFESGGPGSGIYRSGDGGVTWAQITGHGLPTGILGRIGISVSGADGNRVYAIIEATRGGVYRSDNGGDSWQLTNADHSLTQRSWYFHHIFADTKNADVVYVLNTSILRSIDGGRTWGTMRGTHGDNHGFWIDPTNPDWIINSNDGGAAITHDAGRSWSSEDNQPTAEFYHVDTDTRYPYMLYGAQQDNSTVAISSAAGFGGRGGGGGAANFYDVGGGESGWVVPKRDNPDVTYAGSYDGLLTEYNHATGFERDINAWPLNTMGAGAADILHRFQWTFPIAASPHDPNTIYIGAEMIFSSSNGGSSWTSISPDLTRNEKSKQASSGGPLSQDNTSVEYYDTVFCIAESPISKGEIWAGTDDGLVQLTRDGGKTWSNVTPKGIPEWIKVSIVAPSPTTDGTAYIALDGQKLDDMRPYLYKTNDFGKTWKKITNGIPDGSITHSVKEDTKRKGLLFAGTESGVYVSFDDGVNWKSLRGTMPNTPVHDMVIKDDDLVIATHGRSFYVMDNITPLREMTSEVETADTHLFTPTTAIRGRGMTLDYWLKSAPQGPITIEISDASGKVIRTFTGRAAAPGAEENAGGGGGGRGRGGEGGFGGGAAAPTVNVGMNRFTWDLRTDPPSSVPNAVYWGGRASGVAVSAGTYNVKLTAGSQSSTAKVNVKTDPRLHVSQEDLDKQFEFATRINSRISAGHDAINQIRSLRTQIDSLRQRLPASAEYKPVLDAAEALNKKMTAVEEEMIQTKSTSNEDALNFPIRVVNQLVDLFGTVESADAAPTAQSYEVFEVLNAKLTASLAKWDDIQKTDLADLNAKMAQANVPGVSLPPAGRGGTGGRGGRRGGN